MSVKTGRISAALAVFLPAFLCTAGEEEERVKVEFEAIASTLENSSNAFLGRGQIESLSAIIENAKLTFPRRAAARLELSHHYLRWGRIDEAESCLEPLLDPASPIPAGKRGDVLFALALVKLRKAERANCIEMHDRECCIFPLAGGGIHTKREPAREARKSLLKLLELQPDRLDAQWLLNIAAMACGEYPDGVPAEFRLPPESVTPAGVGTGHWPDVAGSLGVDAFDLCGGVMVADFDGNGFLDIVASTSDPAGSMKFFLNGGEAGFKNATEGSGLDAQFGGLNCVGADYDNDGDRDILVLRGAWLGREGQIRNSLLRNNGRGRDGKVTFTDVTRRAGLADRKFPTQAAAWGDFDSDGDLDLFISNESRLTTQAAEDFPCQLFRNNGDGTFSDVASSAGVRNDRFSKGATVGDYDNDGDLDLFVSNVGECRLYRNDGGMKFSDVAKSAGVLGAPGYNFAPWFFDYDNDGWLDIFLAGYHAALSDFMLAARGRPHEAALPRLYRNNGDGTFTDRAGECGLDGAWLPMGANFGDIDNDGWLDIYLATGDPRFEFLVPNIMLKNEGGAKFVNVTWDLGLGHLQKGHGVAFADFDRDGDQDLYNQLGGFYPDDKFRNALFLNPGTPNHYHWVAIELTGAMNNRDAIGARVAVEVSLPGGETRAVHRAVGSVSSFGGSPLRQEIGLGPATAIRKITVRWPGGAEEAFTSVALDSAVQITEGTGRAVSRKLDAVKFRSR